MGFALLFRLKAIRWPSCDTAIDAMKLCPSPTAETGCASMRRSS
jgi:hypothetical protein